MSVSRLCLGTAKLGMPWYGVGSVSHPSPSDVEEILTAAPTLGVRWLDTGVAYGDAEEWLRQLPFLREHCRMVTKVSPALARLGAVASRMEESCWEYVLLHNPSPVDLLDPTILATIQMFPVRAGVSIYAPDEAAAAQRCTALHALQVPYCVVDQRHHDTIRAAKRAGMLVMARQPFLQGVLTNPVYRPGVVPESMLSLWRRFCREAGVTTLQAALWFALESEADLVVFGCGSLQHLREVVEAAQAPRPESWPELYSALRDEFREGRVQLASLWSRPPGA